MSRSLVLAVALCAFGCSVDPFELTFHKDGGASFADANSNRADARAGTLVDASSLPDAGPGMDGGIIPGCTPSPESCNGADDDCDRQIDEDFNTQSDPRHCGGCNRPCSRTNSLGTCSTGTCSFSCLPGFNDIDQDPNNGCEYLCIPTNNGTETCDGIDNDCDKQIDEDFNLDSDPNNCGRCLNKCQPLNATGTCTAGVCGYDRTAGCTPPWVDIDPNDDLRGCRYMCLVSPPTAELCDNKDNDCDGQVDEDAPGGGEPCGIATGECEQGVTRCAAGAVVCTGAKGPTAELCDGKNNDCDKDPNTGVELVDEGFDRLHDPRNCGPTCKQCGFTNAVAKCIPGASNTGECAIAVCLAGFVDLDKDPNNGCEYPCTVTGGEVCDGADNNCDGAVDNNMPVPNALCNSTGPCANTVPVCGKGNGDPNCDQSFRWRCPYSASVEKDTCGNLVANEAKCDNLDGDCDGTADDAFPTKGTLCGDNGVGICRKTGTNICNAAGTAVECALDPNSGAVAASDDDTCDGINDDCDLDPNGLELIDEDAVGAQVPIPGGVLVDVYEASRPDADPNSVGKMEHRACSKEKALPWTNVTRIQAAAICQRSGKRLCTELEWQEACEGAANQKYPYPGNYDGDACNGTDFTSGPDDAILPTGDPALAACVSPYGAHDMSGNAKEWTSTQADPSNNPTLYRIRGGAYDSVAPGLTCDFDFVAAEETYAFVNLGFRCCDQ